MRPPDRTWRYRALSLREIEVEHRLVDVSEGDDVGGRHALVDLVHGEPDEAELGDRAELMDETRIRGAARRAELGRAAAGALDRGGQQVAHRAGGRQEGFAADAEIELVAPAHRGELLLDPRFEPGAGPAVVEADVEDGARLGRDDVGGGIADIDGR